MTGEKNVTIKQNLQLFPVKVHRWSLKDFFARIASSFRDRQLPEENMTPEQSGETPLTQHENTRVTSMIKSQTPLLGAPAVCGRLRDVSAFSRRGNSRPHRAKKGEGADGGSDFNWAQNLSGCLVVSAMCHQIWSLIERAPCGSIVLSGCVVFRLSGVGWGLFGGVVVGRG